MDELKKKILLYMIGNRKLKELLVELCDESDVKNKTEIAALTAIAVPGSATASDCATKINAVIAALKA